MGNETSQLSGLEVEDVAIETTDFWSHYKASVKDSCRYYNLKGDGAVSVFKGEPVLGSLWTISTPLEKFSNNLLKYRHPYIVRYISAWKQRSTVYLATEYVQPLSHVLKSLAPHQMCIGLNNILCALVFLHDQAGMSHNNVSMSSIYVTEDGQWKLGGLQYLCAINELTQSYLKQAAHHRYEKAIDPSEETHENLSKVDQYGFAVLVEDVFKGWKDDNVPYLQELRRYCTNCLQHSDVMKRPRLSEVLQHNFFNQEFINIYKFLNYLPLKSEEEKQDFFSNILENLKCYDEETVARQLSGLLLSRHALLDSTARKEVIPYIIKPKNERSPGNTGFFTLSLFKEYVKPRIMQIFGVRDLQIRMLLLTHFTKYVNVFTHEELSQQILPELLLGIKDTNDNLVSATLICLSELVPVLGAATVVGGKRLKLFADGRPNSKTTQAQSNNIFTHTKSLQDLACTEKIYRNDDDEFDKPLELIERPSPVGGEALDDDIVATSEVRSKLLHSDEEWSDWDGKTNLETNIPNNKIHEEVKSQEIIENKEQNASINKAILQKAAYEAKNKIFDISDLDIKNQKVDVGRKTGDEFDFFADMAPVIEKPQVVDVLSDTSQEFSSKLNFVPHEDDEGNEGWDENWNE